MKLSAVLLLLTAIVSTYGCDLNHDVDHHWDMFKLNHPKVEHLTEESVRKELFRKAHKIITNHNNGNHNYTMAHNMFSDMHKHEKKAYMGLILPEDVETDVWTADSCVNSRVPASLDWRTDACLQPVKDQGQCGACWAFSAVGTLEFQCCKKHGQAMPFSVQQLVDCDPYDSGCSGGWYYNAWRYLQSDGSNSAFDYDYTSTSGSCRYNSAAVKGYVSSFFKVDSNPASIIDALQSGILSVALDVVSSFQYYSSGVYSSSGCASSPNHAVILVGYGSLAGQDYWVVRNSWGVSWGVGGYILVQRGVNMCNIENYVYRATCA